MFINETNANTSSVLSDTWRPYRDQLRRMLGLLDGAARFSYSIWYVPDDAGWPDAPGFRVSDWDGEYLQSAGSAARLTVELRRLEGDGEYHQYAVGRPDDDPALPEETVAYGEHSVVVRPSEVFDADTAVDVYFHYFRTRTTPHDLHLRELDLA